MRGFVITFSIFILAAGLPACKERKEELPVAIGELMRRSPQAMIATAKAHITLLKAAVEDYKMDNSKLPGALDELLLPNEGNMNEPYLEKREYLVDPWGNPYVYNHTTGNRFEIISLGADGLEGGESENADLSSVDLVAR